MIDLCIDARMSSCSGIGTCIRELVPLINSPPFRVILLVKEEQKWASQIEQILFPLPIYSIREQILFPIKIPGCDLFWSPHYNIPLFSIRAKKRITTIHDACHLALSDLLSMIERGYAKFMMSQAIHRSHRIITDSHFSKRELTKYLGPPKREIHVIPNGVNRELFNRIRDPSIQEAVKKKYNLPDRFVLFVGNLKPHKNITGLLQAFSVLSNETLVLVGKCNELRNSIEKINQERVLAVGEIPDVEIPIFYSMAQIFVFPSFYEGFGLPPLEAMSCGCPTISSHSASIPEVCGDATLYIDPNQPSEMAKAIQKVMNDSKIKEKLIDEGFRRVEQFKWSDAAEKYRTLFEQVHLQ